MPPSAAIYGCAGLTLTPNEAGFFRDAGPWGFILFARNVRDPEQLRRLTGELRDTAGRDAPILIDQEGGRVQRLKPPHWRSYPAARRFGALYERDRSRGLEAVRLGARLIAAELGRVGVDVDCLPLLDVPAPGAHDIIGDRAYGTDPAAVAALGRAAAEGLMAGGVLPVVKHVPGHGRAGADSHQSLPVVAASARELEQTDFAPFKALADLPLAMTAHVVYRAIDDARPATTSPTVVGDVIRGKIGFDGLLMTDDLSMKALDGDFEARARASLDAGCDLVLHCNGRMDEMTAVAKAVPPLAGEGGRRAEAAEAMRTPAVPFDEEAALDRLGDLIGAVA